MDKLYTIKGVLVTADDKETRTYETDSQRKALKKLDQWERDGFVIHLEARDMREDE